ncbi:MAG: hypothetical protein LBN74_08175 [Prevotella sp.]|jgi:hypothetical protein|nr:hypothetical protein [Prevotella sp.]
MKKKHLLNPIQEIILAIALLVAIVLIVNHCAPDIRQDEVINEMLEYHSAPGQLVVERDGYVNIIKQ